MPLACGKCGNAGRCVEGGFFANQPAIFQMEDAIAVGEHARVVSDHERPHVDGDGAKRRRSAITAQPQVESSAAVGSSSEQNGRIARESTGNGDALFQSAAQVGGQFGGTFAFCIGQFRARSQCLTAIPCISKCPPPNSEETPMNSRAGRSLVK